MSAIISACGRYRYRLERQCEGVGATAIIMVNPSTADAELDDATIRKLRGFGDRNKWGTLIVGNLFAYRATDVRELGFASDPVGPENATHLARMICDAHRIVFAWGPVAKQPRRVRHHWRAVDLATRYALKQPLCIGEPAQCGHPKHPLMLAYSSPIIEWNTPAEQ